MPYKKKVYTITAQPQNTFQINLIKLCSQFALPIAYYEKKKEKTSFGLLNRMPVIMGQRPIEKKREYAD